MLEQYDPGKTITEEEYKKRLKAGQAKLARAGLAGLSAEAAGHHSL